jgi:hypothetical protein
MDPELPFLGILATPQPFEQPSGDINGSDVGQHPAWEYLCFHIFFIFGF